MKEFARWTSSECPIEVEYAAGVMEQIRQNCVTGLLALRRTGLGVGGLLLGEQRGARLIRVVALEEIECSHAMGPGFVLSNAELDTLRQRLNQKYPLAVLGVYISKPRGELTLSESQTAVVKELFGNPHQVALLIRPGSLEPSLAAFCFWDAKVLKRSPEWEVRPWQGEMVSVPELEFETAAAPARMPAVKAAAGFDGMGLGGDVLSVPKPRFQPAPISVRFTDDVTKPDPVMATSPEVPVRQFASTLSPEEPSPVPSPQTFAPSPIQIKFDETGKGMERPTESAGFLAIGERLYIGLRAKAGKIAAYAGVLLLLGAIAAGAYFSRPLWMTSPPADLKVVDSNGTLVFKWNPESAQFVDAGTLSILDGRRKTIALTHSELMKGRLDYVRTTGNVTASLALDDRRFLVAFNDPSDTKAPAKTEAPAQPEPRAVTTPAPVKRAPARLRPATNSTPAPAAPEQPDGKQEKP